MSAPQPGWYPDPDGGPMLLWWDGARWLYRGIPIETDSSGMTASELARSRDDRYNRTILDAQRTVQELVRPGDSGSRAVVGPAGAEARAALRPPRPPEPG